MQKHLRAERGGAVNESDACVVRAVYARVGRGIAPPSPTSEELAQAVAYEVVLAEEQAHEDEYDDDY